MKPTAYCVGVVISKVYHITVYADSPEGAEEIVFDMEAEEICRQGSLNDEFQIEHIEVIE